MDDQHRTDDLHAAPPSRTARPGGLRAQYEALKRQHPGRILLFQLGDFYETFETDAQIVARVCDVALTSKELSRGDRVPLAGVPVARAEPHIGKLVSAGYHVAICDQMSEPGKGLVERQVTRIVTPGTVAEPGLVSPSENNLLAAIFHGRHAVGLATVDVTTGEVLSTTIEGPDTEALLASELQRLAPAECLVAEGTGLVASGGGQVTPLAASRFDLAAADERLRRLYGVGSLAGFGLPVDSPALAALGALLDYVGEANYRLLASLREPRSYAVGAYLGLDPTTRRNLDLTRTARQGQARGSLLHAVDRTRTPMGARRLRNLLGQPLLDRAALERRLDAVAWLVADAPLRGRVRTTLGRLGDVERLVGRVRQQTATPRDVLTLAVALRALPSLRHDLEGGAPDGAPVPDLLATLAAVLDDCPAVSDLIESAVAEPGGARVIQPGYSAELDDLLAGMTEARRWLANLERRERERTGIRSLKVGYNRVFGYYLEVSRPNAPHVPPDYQRRQTLVNAERFVTSELKEREALILTAEARVEDLERELFLALLRRIAERAAILLGMADAIADLDVLASLADLAADRAWARPSFVDGDLLEIEAGRHPVLEAIVPPGEVVPSDCRLGGVQGRGLIVTGPNMGGKSTYLRMVALVVLLAQSGSFVPARAVRLGPIDRLFTRVGSEDDLVAGASTFLVEMAETANILRHATARSLIVLDEVGRGTSTNDGLAIAQAVLEHLHDVVEARTLFATHFHELTALAEALEDVRNVTVAVDERDGGLAFLYRVVPGAADRSYGVQVARLAGLPLVVTERAASLLRERAETASQVGHAQAGLVHPGRSPREHASLGAITPIDPTPVRPGPLDGPDDVATPDGNAGLGGTARRSGSKADLTSLEDASDGRDRLALPDWADQDDGDSGAGRAAEINRGADGDVATDDAGLTRAGWPLGDGAGAGDDGRDLGSHPPRRIAEQPPTWMLERRNGEKDSGRAAGGEGRAAGGEVAARVLSEVLALDLGNVTPIRALNVLHELQAAARTALPWQAWISALAAGEPLPNGYRGQSERQHTSLSGPDDDRNQDRSQDRQRDDLPDVASVTEYDREQR